MTVLIFFLIALLLIYVFVIISFFLAWVKYPAFSNTDKTDNIFVSIIIPARNEEVKIAELLSNLPFSILSLLLLRYC